MFANIDSSLQGETIVNNVIGKVNSRLHFCTDIETVLDEQHFLLECSNCKQERIALFNHIQNKNFGSLSIQQKFIWLMSNEDVKVCKAMSHFILQSFNIKAR